MVNAYIFSDINFTGGELMGLFESAIYKILNLNLSFNNPIFIKGFEEENDQIVKLEELLSKPTIYDVDKVKEDLKLYKIGMFGEKNVAYELKNSHMPILIIHNLQIEFEQLKAQIDYIVIGQKFLMIIECKNMIGDIEITSNGDFIRHYKNRNGRYYKKEGMYSPITQNERHIKIVKDVIRSENIIKDNILDEMVIHRIIIANPKTVINSKVAKKEIKEKIIKLDHLNSEIEKLNKSNDRHILIEEKMRQIGSVLLKYNKEESTINLDKYIINSSKINDDDRNLEFENKKQSVLEMQEKEIEKKDEIKVSHEENEPISEDALYKELKQYRYNKSREEKSKPYFVFTNESLEQIVSQKPKNRDALMKIKGISSVKCDKYGNDIINIVMEYL